jgi:N-acylglucosamine-6-phosphate 2-epimerase
LKGRLILLTKNAEAVLAKLKTGLIVSCQARNGWAMHGSNIMAAFAKAAEEGGAVGIRANGTEDINAIRQRVRLPIIGISKIWDKSLRVFITPDYCSAKNVIEAGASIVAMDGTKRERPNGETLESIIKRVHDEYPDISTFEEGIYSSRCGADIISTTLCGYTPQTSDVKEFSFELLEKLVKNIKKPIIAEGKIHTKEDAAKILKWGCHSIVVGTAITRPEIITSWFVKELNNIR